MALIQADWWMYALIAIGVAFLIPINIYILVLWQHPDDKNEAYFPKALVIFGLTLAQGAVLFLPLDVANNAGNVECDQSWSDAFCGALNMALAWEIIFYMIFIMAFFMIPYTIFFYEEDDTEVMDGAYNFSKTFCIATKYMMAVSAIIALITGVSFYFLGITSLPVKQNAVTVTNLLTGNFTHPIYDDYGFSAPLNTTTTSALIVRSNQTVELTVTFGLYLMALMSFIGWFLFAIFAGLGMAAIPFDLFRAYRHRPERLDRAQLASRELTIQRRCKELVELGALLKDKRIDSKLARGGYMARRKRGATENSEFRRFKQMVYILEEDYELFAMCKEYSTKYNPLKPIGWLLMGFISSIFASLWVCQMVVYMLPNPPWSPFLNTYFVWFDSWFPLFGALSVALFSMYLLVACVKGCFKFGLRFMWFSLHPMKPNGTYMNSFLFNVGIILMCVPAVLQFSVQAFDTYAASANINALFNVQVRYLRFFRYFYVNDVFIWMLLLLTLLSAIYLGCKRNDVSASTKQVRDALRHLDTKGKAYEESRAAAKTNANDD